MRWSITETNRSQVLQAELGDVDAKFQEFSVLLLTLNNNIINEIIIMTHLIENKKKKKLFCESIIPNRHDHFLTSPSKITILHSAVPLTFRLAICQTDIVLLMYGFYPIKMYVCIVECLHECDNTDWYEVGAHIFLLYSILIQRNFSWISYLNELVLIRFLNLTQRMNVFDSLRNKILLLFHNFCFIVCVSFGLVCWF